MSKYFIELNRELFGVMKTRVFLSRSERDTTEEKNEVVLEADIRLESHTYRSGFVVMDWSCDVLLGMQYHRLYYPQIDYYKAEMRLHWEELPFSDALSDRIFVSTLSIGKF